MSIDKKQDTITIDFAPLDDIEYKRQARLLRAQHCAYPVQFAGQDRFIHSLHSGPAGGHIEMTVYLTGDATPIDSEQISLKERA